MGACAAAGFPGRIPYDLQRSAVRNMERAGLSRSVAMQLTGHETAAVSRRYAITCEATSGKAWNGLTPEGGTKRFETMPRGQIAETIARMQALMPRSNPRKSLIA